MENNKQNQQEPASREVKGSPQGLTKVSLGNDDNGNVVLMMDRPGDIIALPPDSAINIAVQMIMLAGQTKLKPKSDLTVVKNPIIKP